MVTEIVFINLFSLLLAALLASWGSYTIYQEQLSLRVGWLACFDVPSVRIVGLMAILESAAIVSFTQGHLTSALVMLAVTLPLLTIILGRSLSVRQLVK